ncbi:N-6 DNA methylase [Pseudomonas sp. NPDC047961]
MNEKLIRQLLDVARALDLPHSAAVSLILQLLCWRKLSNEETAIPAELRFNQMLSCETREQFEALQEVQSYTPYEFLDASVWQYLRGSRDLGPLLEKICSLETQGLLDELVLDDVGFWLLDRYDGGLAVAPSLCDLLIKLAQVSVRHTVYLPWENAGQIGSRVIRSGAHAIVEAKNPTHTAQVLGLASVRGWDMHDTDPIGVPAALEAGNLIRFEKAISVPPMGLRYAREVSENDLWDRFPEKTPVGAVLQIRHLLAQTSGRIVVVVPNSILFASGSERLLRERLVNTGQLETVIGLPAGLCVATHIPLSILVLNASGGAENVCFVNAATQMFTENATRKRTELKDIDTLVALAIDREPSEHAVSVSTEAIAANDFSLEVTRYVLDESARQLEASLARYPLGKLGDFFNIIRPRQHATSAKGAPVFEVQAQDIPAYGYIRSASKEALFDLSSAKASTYFIKPDDVLVTFKGTIGKAGIARDVPKVDEGGWIAGQSLAILRSQRPELYPPKSLLLYLRSAVGQASLNRIAVGATIPSIQLSALKDLEIPVPSASEMATMAHAFEQQAQIQEEIQQLRAKQAAISAEFWTL